MAIDISELKNISQEQSIPESWMGKKIQETWPQFDMLKLIQEFNSGALERLRFSQGNTFDSWSQYLKEGIGKDGLAQRADLYMAYIAFFSATKALWRIHHSLQKAKSEPIAEEALNAKQRELMDRYIGVMDADIEYQVQPGGRIAAYTDQSLKYEIDIDYLTSLLPNGYDLSLLDPEEFRYYITDCKFLNNFQNTLPLLAIIDEVRSEILSVVQDWNSLDNINFDLLKSTYKAAFEKYESLFVSGSGIYFENLYGSKWRLACNDAFAPLYRLFLYIQTKEGWNPTFSETELLHEGAGNIIYETTYAFSAAEGIDLEGRCIELFELPRKLTDKLREQNTDNTMKFISELVPKLRAGTPLTLEDLDKLHEIAWRGLLPPPYGKMRTNMQYEVGYFGVEAPDSDKVKDLMAAVVKEINELIAEINQGKANVQKALLKIARLMAKTALIHPFADGNGTFTMFQGELIAQVHPKITPTSPERLYPTTRTPQQRVLSVLRNNIPAVATWAMVEGSQLKFGVIDSGIPGANLVARKLNAFWKEHIYSPIVGK